MTAKEIHNRLAALANPEQAAILQRFFKTGPGQYGEGDVFIGIRIPVLRKMVREYQGIPLHEAEALLESPIHEERLLALFLFVKAFSKASDETRKHIYEHYLGSTRFINNWDLVDLSAEHIVGAYLFDKNRSPLYRLAGSANLWERRISVLSTFHYIKKREFGDTLGLSKKLLRDRHDLIHKAVGWMLREVGKRDLDAEEGFLSEHYMKMPRTMLRYAIEKFPEPKRQKYLRGEI